MKKPGFILLLIIFHFAPKAQPGDCTFLPPQISIDFGVGDIRDMNSTGIYNYRRVFGYCPTDGHYSFAPYTSGCFRDDWHTLLLDHTDGDAEGNMLLVNAAPGGGMFLSVPVSGLKANTTYELGLWLINLCRPTKKCPYLLLPSLNIRLETVDGKVIANIVTRDLPRVEQPIWSQHRAFFTTPASTSTLWLVMTDNAPGGCGNDFALDDITFRECVKKKPPVAATKKTTPPATKQVASNPVTKKVTTAPPKKVAPTPPKNTAATTPKKVQAPAVVKTQRDTVSKTVALSAPPKQFVPAPLVLKTREIELAKKIETEAGEIRISLYDNGEIDGDTVSIYHNNKLIKSHMRLSVDPITITIQVNASEPRHELTMVAENLGSIPPNTSVMVINAPGKRYEVFISSNEQKNARVVFELKK